MKQTSLKEIERKQAIQAKLYQDCLKILRSQSIEENNKWLIDNKINSYTLRNDKAQEIVITLNFIFQKALVSGNLSSKFQVKQGENLENFMLSFLFVHYKSVSKRIIEFCHLLKHFSLWDYEFEFFYQVFLGMGLNNINLYVKCRSQIIQSGVNRYKKSILSGVLAEIEQWSKLVQNIFKIYNQRTIIQLFVEVVRLHYITVKKNQNQKINGAQFFKICQIMSEKLFLQNKQFQNKQKDKNQNLLKKNKIYQDPTVGEIFKESLLNDLTKQDRELIRILSCKDKNIARLLEQKHNKAIYMIILDDKHDWRIG